MSRNRRHSSGSRPRGAQSQSRKPLTATSFLPLARIVGIGVALSAGLAVCLGSYSDIVASDGPANFILPFVIAIVVAGGLAAGWHVAFGMAAQAETGQEKAVAAIIGAGLVVIGTATSAWFLAGKIGGTAAIQAHQSAHIRELQKTEELVASNAAKDAEVLRAAEIGATGLDAKAEGEGNFGVVSGKAGFKGIYQVLKSAANALHGSHRDLRGLNDKRSRFLLEARQEIERAVRAIADHDAASFKEAAGRAAAKIADAGRIRLSGVAGSISIAATSGPAGQEIRSATDALTVVARNVEAQLRPVSIPVYQPVDAKTAVTLYPQPLTWLMAILIECLPLIMLGLLIGLPPK